MKISEAAEIIKKHFEAGLLSIEESKRLHIEIRRTGSYGRTWSFKEQNERRAFVMKDFV